MHADSQFMISLYDYIGVGLGSRERRLHKDTKRSHQHGQFGVILFVGHPFGLVFDRFVHQIVGCFHVPVFAYFARSRSHNFCRCLCTVARSNTIGGGIIIWCQDEYRCGCRNSGCAKTVVGQPRPNGQALGR